MIIGLCHGCFDLIHIGHLMHFVEARDFCDKLYVSISSDRFAVKSPGRPIFSQYERLQLISALRMVDRAFITDQETAVDVITSIRPHYYFKGSDYLASTDHRFQLEANACVSVECKLIYTASPKYSTTDYILKCSSAASSLLV